MGKTKPAARFGSRRNVICSTAPAFEGAGFGKEESWSAFRGARETRKRKLFEFSR